MYIISYILKHANPSPKNLLFTVSHISLNNTYVTCISYLYFKKNIYLRQDVSEPWDELNNVIYLLRFDICDTFNLL